MYQQIIIVGNLGKDPEMRYTPSGTPVTSLSVATNRKYTGSDGQVVKETTWFRVSVFGKMAETCAQYLKKGSAVLVEGRLTPDKNSGGPRTFQRQDGTMGATYEVFANNVRFLGSRGEGSPSPTAAPSEDDVPVGTEDEIHSKSITLRGIQPLVMCCQRNPRKVELLDRAVCVPPA